MTDDAAGWSTRPSNQAAASKEAGGTTLSPECRETPVTDDFNILLAYPAERPYATGEGAPSWFLLRAFPPTVIASTDRGASSPMNRYHVCGR